METNPSLMGFINVVSQLFGIPEFAATLMVGAIAGAVILGVFGQLALKMKVWRTARDAAYKPQTFQAPKTPQQVVRESRKAARKLLLFWLFFLAVAGYFLIDFITRQTGQENVLIQSILGLLRSILP